MSQERIVDLVFSRTVPRARNRLALASLGALLSYAVAAALVLRSEVYLAEWGQTLSRRIGAALDRVHVVERRPPEVRARPEQPPLRTPPAPEPVMPRRGTARAAAPKSFAQAGAIVALDPAPGEAVDLTGDTFVTGKGPVYGGGFTKSSGMSTTAVHHRPQKAAAPYAITPDQSSPVQLPDPAWSCPWPVEADGEAQSEQTAIIQVTVRADGSVEAATVLVDPGHGFGEAARKCALQSRFVPARDRSGRARRAVSPPIRVRFVR